MQGDLTQIEDQFSAAMSSLHVESVVAKSLVHSDDVDAQLCAFVVQARDLIPKRKQRFGLRPDHDQNASEMRPNGDQNGTKVRPVRDLNATRTQPERPRARPERNLDAPKRDLNA